MYLVPILIGSILLQLAAAALAWRLVRISSRPTAWRLIALALILMIFRRGFSLYYLFRGVYSADLWTEVVALATSALMLIGVLFFTALLRSLDQAHEKQRALSQKLISMQEEERTRISRELHDELGQQLAALRLEIGWLRKQSPDGEDSEFLQNLMNMALGVTAELRRICKGLRPTALDYMGLGAALETLVRDFEAHSQLEVEYAADQTDRISLAPETAIGVYRIMQEALTNTARHSGARRVEVRLRIRDSQILLTVEDDGKGFPGSATEFDSGFGIIGMRERAALCGGEIRFETGPEGGATVKAEIPIRAPIKEEEA